MGITVLTHALKVVRKPGGFPTKTVKEVISIPGARKIFSRTRMRAKERQPGSDYTIFNCPLCNKRNSACVYAAKEKSQDGRLVFRCNGCYSDVAVQRPIGDIKQDSEARPPVLLGPDGKQIR